jgi:polysaccharide export outer membrane protein
MRPFALVPLLLAAACTPKLATVPAAPTDDSSFVATTKEPEPGLDEPASEDDVLCPGDLLSVRTFGVLDMGPGSPAVPPGAAMDSPEVLVDRGGKIHLPLIGDVPVGGKSVTAAESLVQTKVTTVDRFARVAIMLADPRGHYATVGGAVVKVGPVPLIGDAHFIDVIAAAGGPLTTSLDGKFTAVGDMDAARVLRNGVPLPIDPRLALEGNPRHNIRIHAGDVIMVPPAFLGRIVILGHVSSSKTLPYRKGYRLLEAIGDAGGFSSDADYDDVRVLRGGYAHPRVFVANVKDLLAARRPDITLAPGDVVYVSQHWTGGLAQIVNQLSPLLEGVLVTEALAH